MPGRNIIKQYAGEMFYHVYSRGVAKQLVFLDEQDYGYFVGLFKRYLSAAPHARTHHEPYPHFAPRVDLVAFCLMPNHVHLLLYQKDATAMQEFMRSVMTSYSMYFNKKYERVGPVFQSRYRASRIDKDNYLEHITRYIHLNPTNWRGYKYSSLPYYLRQREATWIQPAEILHMFQNDPAQYLDFLKDYKGHTQMLDELKWELAHE